ncbi:hypothetical protein IP70_22110 [alpha proteobacterium AAP38]|nr:hypothetical protein IP70_22110 [alpha proteobacterium AAP38]
MLTNTASQAQSVIVPDAPDFGPNVVVVTPMMTVEQINAAIAPLPNDPRRQIFFMPGTYGSAEGAANPDTARNIIAAHLNANTAMAGLGKSPEGVRINGALHIDVAGFAALVTFARSLSNLTINPIQRGLPPNTMRWQTSQTAHWRRVNLLGSLDVVGNPPTYAFGSVIANSRITGIVDVGDSRNTTSGPGGKANAMYYVRDSAIGGWKGFASQMVFSGVMGAPADNFGPGGPDRSNAGDKVTLPTTPLSREAPFLYVEEGQYKVFVPKARRDSAGVNWSVKKDVGTSMPIDRFLIAQPRDPVEKLNEALASGKDIILTPGDYQLTAPLRVARADAVILGLGFAQLNAVNGTEALIVADVPGVVLSGFGIGTGHKTSDVLVRIGTPGVRSGDASNPTTLSDVHIAGNAVTTEIIDQDHVLVDGAWIRTWRDGKIEWADAANSFGVVVNGNNVSWTGLWVEHFKKTQITWNGDGGRVVFLQNEPPYEPPSQAVWMNGEKPGYPSLKIADHVKSFRLDGFSTYTRFSNGCECFVWSAIETPVSPTIRFHGLTAASILYPIPGGGFTKGGYKHIINDLGPAVDAGVDSGHSRLPHSDVFGFTANHRIANFPDKLP